MLRFDGERPVEMGVRPMFTVDCPWCEDRMVLDDAPMLVGTCEACGIRAEIAPDATTESVALAA